MGGYTVGKGFATRWTMVLCDEHLHMYHPDGKIDSPRGLDHPWVHFPMTQIQNQLDLRA